MKQQFVLIIGLLTILSLNVFSQEVVYFSYDEAGNRTKREIIDLSKSSNIGADSAGWLEAEGDNLADNKILIYPNPTKGKLKIDISTFKEGTTGQLMVYDLSGKILLQRYKIYASNMLNLDHLATGIYFLKLSINNSTKEWKIIKK